MGTLKRVLIVDDDPILRVIVHSYFENLGGLDVLQAANGRAALEIIEQRGHEIDYVLCDLNMPELDGIQFLRKLKDHEFAGAICILSGEDRAIVQTAQRLADSLRLNVVGALQKPLDIGDLNRLVTNVPAGKPAEDLREAVSISEWDLREAITGGRIVPFYQPKVSASSGEIVGAEALARWMHTKLGIVGPGDFIPLAERTGLIEDLTGAILGKTLDDLKRWNKRGISVKVAINIAPQLFRDLELPDRLSAQTDAAQLSPSNFVLEITESGILQKNSNTMEVLTRLRMKGYGLSVDDFGTGHSNIDQLSKFPFSELKIDRSYIQGARHDGLARAAVEAAVLLGRELRVRLVAEGVETLQDWHFVNGHGIDEVQGFYIAKPMPADEFEQWHNDNGGVFSTPDDLNKNRDQRRAAHV